MLWHVHICSHGTYHKRQCNNLASTVMKIILQLAFCHTIFLNKDSKFFGVCCKALDLLQINCHVLSGSNHKPMLVEQLNRYLNQGLRIMCNERNSHWIALEGVLLLIYAWNSCPVLGTDISRCMVMVGREFAFPIDFLVWKYAELFSAPGTVLLYSKDLAMQLECCTYIAMLLVWEQHCWHCKLIHSWPCDSGIYHEGNILFARCATQSDTKHDRVNKLMHLFTGPWRIMKSLSGSLYKIKCVHMPSWCNKKHASDLSLYPPELIPFKPINIAHNCYDQLYRLIVKSPYKEASIKGFMPPQPFQIASHFLTKGDFRDFHFPMLAALTNDVCPFLWLNEGECICVLSGNDFEEAPNLFHGPTPSLAVPSPPPTPILSSLVASIIGSFDCLFFISLSLGNPTTRKWRLVRIAFTDSMALSPSCLQDGQILVEFDTLHHADIHFNAINQQYWLQYHSMGDISTPFSSTTMHLIRPSDTSKAHAAHLHLMPFLCWINLTHSDMLLYSPFEFTTINARKMHYCISKSDWDILLCYGNVFENPLPWPSLPSYFIHVDPGVHLVICNQANATG
jgi:hypothetical protein